MKLKAVLTAMFLSTTAVADTTIYFEDGTSLTTPSDIYLSDRTVYTKREQSGKIIFDPQDPVITGVPEKPEPEPSDDILEIEYCQNFDTSEGLTFNYVNWQKRCDTNEDGEYKFCEDWVYTGPLTFQAVWWNRACTENPDFTPVGE